MITSESKIPTEDESPINQGIFQLFGDTLTSFNEECVNTISERSLLPKQAAEVIWTGPPSGSGCVILKAMVLEDRTHWYADDGKLSLELCEQVEQVSLEECCACDEAKYNVSNVVYSGQFWHQLPKIPA